MPMQETQEMRVQSLGWEDPLEEEMATHSSIPAKKIPRNFPVENSERDGHTRPPVLPLEKPVFYCDS